MTISLPGLPPHVVSDRASAGVDRPPFVRSAPTTDAKGRGPN